MRLHKPPRCPAGLRPTASCGNTTQSDLYRFWELEKGSDCGTFALRGQRPISLSWTGSNSVNTAPSSTATGHTAAFRACETAEMRIRPRARDHLHLPDRRRQPGHQ